jgi:DNA-binding transcriptional regulator YdaS (Cro superfamily)
MKHDHSSYTPEAATDEPASPPYPIATGEGPAFASDAEEAAYWRGVAHAGGKAGGPARDLLDFDPVPVRYRADGLTPQKQREYVEALADTGVARYAAARIGVSEQAVNRLRRRADAASFNLACEAARRIGARRLHAIAWERAIEGTIKRYHYHGELKSEERVYDNRLLIYLLGKTEHLIEPPRECQAVAEQWEPWMEAMEQGLDPASLLSETDASEREPEPEPAAAEDEDDDHVFDGDEVWQDDEGMWWTRFPPPESGFIHEEGAPGDEDYRRTLSPAEWEVAEEQARDRQAEELARQRARRDAWFGFEGDPREDELICAMGPEPCETSGADRDED